LLRRRNEKRGRSVPGTLRRNFLSCNPVAATCSFVAAAFLDSGEKSIPFLRPEAFARMLTLRPGRLQTGRAFFTPPW
jgi:hypothetical protein